MISVIIPAYNEESAIAETIRQTRLAGGEEVAEIIVVDGGSTDETFSVAAGCGATTILGNKKGRAAQMNRGASIAQSPILYFLHADSIPPPGFAARIMDSHDNGAVSGCFRLAFDLDHWFLKANCWFTRWDVNAVRFGDQSLFVTRDVFFRAGSFREDLWMMEDQEIIHRIKKHGRFTVMPAKITTSARKYRENGIFRMQAIFYSIWLLYYLGCPQEKLLHLHRKLIKKNKL